MPDSNKLTFGLSRLAFAVATIAADGTATYATPIENPGAISISMDPQGDLRPFRADNMDYYIFDDFTGYQGDLEVARFIDAVKAAIWHEAEAANAIKYEATGLEAVHFALLFEFKNDAKRTRHVFYNCTATRPAVASATTGETVEPQTETTTLTATPIYVSALSKNVIKARCEEGDTAYSGWYTAVVQPTASV